jgi:hypothetical protein
MLCGGIYQLKSEGEQPEIDEWRRQGESEVCLGEWRWVVTSHPSMQLHSSHELSTKADYRAGRIAKFLQVVLTPRINVETNSYQTQW